MYQRENRSMKRSVGARASCASSTRRMMRAIVLSSAAFVTRTRSAASRLIEPAKTPSPSPLVRGIDSPVTGDSSMLDLPDRMTPSAGMRSPGRATTVCPMASVLGRHLASNAVLLDQGRLGDEFAKRADAGTSPVGRHALQHLADRE